MFPQASRPHEQPSMIIMLDQRLGVCAIINTVVKRSATFLIWFASLLMDTDIKGSDSHLCPTVSILDSTRGENACELNPESAFGGYVA